MMRMSLPGSEWLPYYFVKKDKRAKRIKLRPSKRHGLIVTVPPRFNLKELPPILTEYRGWIEKHIADFFQETALPHEIKFYANNETWQINYMKSSNRLSVHVRPNTELVLLGNTDDPLACIGKLVQWIKKYAKVFLEKELLQLSEKTKLKFHTLRVRDQQTLWGSCTHQQTISLNYKLIFLPFPLMQHVMLHELCHTVHMDHSITFWKLVASFDPEWHKNKKEIKTADQYVPNWAR